MDGVAVQLPGTGPTDDFQISRQLALRATFSAQRELILTTPYFVPDEATAFEGRRTIRTQSSMPKPTKTRLAYTLFQAACF